MREGWEAGLAGHVGRGTVSRAVSGTVKNLDLKESLLGRVRQGLSLS